MKTVPESDGPALHELRSPSGELLAPPEVAVLLVEDDRADFKHVERLLARAPYGSFALDWVTNGGDATAALSEGHYHVCLLDYRLGPQTGLEWLADQRAAGRALPPVILLTGSADVGLDLRAMVAGVADFIDKDELTVNLLGRAIRYAIRNRALEDRLQEASRSDHLTGLLNARAFRDELDAALRRGARQGSVTVALYLDLDDFKPVNDEYGHDAGDAVLVEVARRLVGCVRETDTVARLGGDEFGVLLEGLDTRDGATRVASAILEQVREPISVGPAEVSVRASIGIAAHPDDAGSVDELIQAADQAMFRAKEPPGDRYVFA